MVILQYLSRYGEKYHWWKGERKLAKREIEVDNNSKDVYH